MEGQREGQFSGDFSALATLGLAAQGLQPLLTNH